MQQRHTCFWTGGAVHLLVPLASEDRTFLSLYGDTFQAAFDKLDSIYGTYTDKSDVKSNFQLPRHCMTNTDLNRIINSDEVRFFLQLSCSRCARWCPISSV